MLINKKPDKCLDKLAIYYVIFVTNFRLFIINIIKKTIFNNKKSLRKKILINRDGAFGDSVVSVPAISIIRQNYPDSQIDLLSISNSGVCIKDIGLKSNIIDNFHIVKKIQRIEKLKFLKKENYDFFIQLPQNIGLYKSIRNMLIARFFLQIKSGIGWDHGRIKFFMRQQKSFLNIPNETKRFIYNLKKENIHGNINYPLLEKRPDDKEIKLLVKTKKTIAFLIGGKLQAKKWPLNNWVELSYLIGNDYTVFLVGGSDEHKEADNILKNTSNTKNLCGKLSILELTYLLKTVKLAVSLDTGARHLCDAVNTKCIILFSTRDLTNKWFPNQESSIVMEKVLPCSFCLKTYCQSNICMTKIKPEDVYNKARLFLN